jgi:hypothetical protein
MANTNAPFGFDPVRRFDGAAWTGSQSIAKIAYDNGTAIYRGDVVKVLDTGYIAQGTAANSSHTNAGIFMGCRYISSANNNPIYSPYWPGSGNLGTGDIEAYVITDPNVVLAVQSDSTTPAQTQVNLNVDFVVGTGNALSGQSGMYLDMANANTTATFPFRILSLPAGVGNGYDQTTGYNIVYVTWNDQFYRQTSGL